MICLQETWTDNNCDISLYQLPNYNLFHQGKQCSDHGGLFIYVHEEFIVEPINIAFHSTRWEGYCLKITQSRPYVRHYVIANIYRPPFEAIDDFTLFNEQFFTLLNKLSNLRHPSYICGDFNINLLKINVKAHYNNFFENTLSSGFFPKITLPTRISETSSTLIDNILTNVIESNGVKAGILTSHISDHQAIFLSTSSKLSRDSGSRYINVETKDDTSLNNFMNELENLNIPAQLNSEPDANPNNNYKIFSKAVNSAKEKHLPIKKTKFNRHKHKINKWITRGILKSINTKNKLYKQLVQTSTRNIDVYEHLKIRFIRFRNILRQSIKDAKKIYFQNIFTKFKHDIKRTWAVINESLHRKNKSISSRMFSHNGKTLEDPSEIANAFNEYFISIGPSLANQMDKNNNFRKYLRNPSESCLHFEPITEHKTMRIIENLKNKTSTGIDGLSNQLIKMAKNVLVKPLTIIINQMIVTGIFPDQLKISKVIPLYKAKDQTILSNYRPIALLPSISKIFEYVLLEQITNYFLDNNMLSPQQYGFRSNHSTELAALNLVDELTYKLDRGTIPLNIYMDLSKAFDTLIHEILISKLKHYGVRGEAIDLIRSYLYQRQQLVEFNGCLSDMRYIETGVLQGSVLGPLLFSIYINDLPSCSDMFKMIMYADDTTLLCDLSNDHDIETLLNNELCKITDWLQAISYL